MGESRRGVLLGLLAWVLWGFFPLYWPLLEPAGAVEILAHRVVWSLVVLVVVAVLLRRRRRVLATMTGPRTRWMLPLAGVLVTANWGVYIYGVNSHHVVETSLGYFINPLVSVLLGVLVLGEQLRRLQWVAIGLAAAAVLALSVEYGRPPWIALVLALTFGLYGLVKKKANAGAIESLVVETLTVAPFALAVLAVLAAGEQSHFTAGGAPHVVLMVGTGVVTAIPLLAFGAAATRIPLSTLGLMQYLTPSIQFLLGITFFGEPMPALRWAGFALIWVALVLFTVESVRARRRVLRVTPSERLPA